MMLFFLKCEWFRNQSLVMVVWGAALLVWYEFYLQVVAGCALWEQSWA